MRITQSFFHVPVSILERAYVFDMIVCLYDSLETTRHVSLITITLSKKELDTSSPG